MSQNENLLQRRDFIKLLGPGLYFVFSIEGMVFGQRPGSTPGSYPDDFNAYLKIEEDNRVTCYTGKVEMGQGIIASLAQMLAEELEVPYESISMVMGDTGLCPWDAGTNGSRSIKYFGPACGPPARKPARCSNKWQRSIFSCRSIVWLSRTESFLTSRIRKRRFPMGCWQKEKRSKGILRKSLL